MSLSLFRPTDEDVSEADLGVRYRQIGVDGQRPLERLDAAQGPIGCA
jgi:hypothetical protein